MCDYSLHNVKTRPAKVGDKLTTRFFQSGTRALARRKMRAWLFASYPVLSCHSQKM